MRPLITVNSWNGRSSECRPCLHEVCRVVTDEDEVNGRSSECRPCLHEVCRVVTDEDEVNEWAETGYLQSDNVYGYGYFNAVKHVFIDDKK